MGLVKWTKPRFLFCFVTLYSKGRGTLTNTVPQLLKQIKNYCELRKVLNRKNNASLDLNDSQ